MNMEKNRKQVWKKYSLQIALALLLAVILVTLAGWWLYFRVLEQSSLDEGKGGREYARHYVMITDDTSSELWKKIYESAKQEGEKQDAWVEMMGDWFADEYSPMDYMDIAIYAKADGIIVKPDGTQKMRDAINEAEEAGIPVITVLEDDTRSARKSFVGINSYQLGTTYGNQILSCLNPDTRSVLVLLNGKDAGRELVFKQLKATVQEGISEERQITVQAMTVDSGNSFDTEEIIQDIFAEEKRPHILVCMNETDSERAYQAMIDHNCVGEVQIIGYYQSGTMLQAVQKGTVPMAITLDAEQMGKYCVEALEEYYQMGHVSSYFSVDLNIMTQENVDQFIAQEEG